MNFKIFLLYSRTSRKIETILQSLKGTCILIHNTHKPAITRKMDSTNANICWTPDMRNAFVERAVTSEDEYGREGHYIFKKMKILGNNGIMEEDMRRSAVTKALAESVHQGPFKGLVMNFYPMLLHKLGMNPVVGHLMYRDFVVVLKGSNAHVYLNGGAIDETFNVSDMDIVVYINPFIERSAFDLIKTQVEITIRQTMSQYKRSIDHTLFLGTNAGMTQPLLPPHIAQEFKDDFSKRIAHLTTLEDGAPIEGVFVSPFDSNDIRNKCSRNSFIIKNSKASDEHVVRVEVPHFDMCERIPLRRTPMFCSFNETINFDRDSMNNGTAHSESKGHFNLYRLKMNVIHKWTDVETGVQREDKIPADFIDVSIPDKDDIELVHFWSHGTCMNVFDKDVGMWLCVPDIKTCISELDRILQQYNSCEHKKDKRHKKVNALRTLAQNMYMY